MRHPSLVTPILKCETVSLQPLEVDYLVVGSHNSEIKDSVTLPAHAKT